MEEQQADASTQEADGGDASDDDGAASGETVEVTMPEMGESVSEGTVLEWHKEPGDSVEEGETIVEVSTDKVDAEVPSPASGTLAEQLVKPDDTVKVGQALAKLETGGGGAASSKGQVASSDEGEALPRTPGTGRVATSMAIRTPHRSRDASPPPKASICPASRDPATAAR